MKQNNRLHGMWFLLLIALIIMALDEGLKFWVQANLLHRSHAFPYYPYGGIGVFKNFSGIEFSLVHETNRGAAWSAFSNFQIQLLVVRLILVAGLLMYLIKGCKDHKSARLPLTLILAGACGNILDYFFYGHVIDMFHFVFWGYDWPVFNIADAAICLGIGWLFLSSCFHSASGTHESV